MIRSVSWVAAALCTATASCGSSSTSPNINRVAETLRAEPVETVYAPGDTVRITFRNTSATDIYVNPCGSSLERFASGGWVSLPPDPAAPNCGDTSHLIHPGETWTGSAGVLKSPLSPGTYRYRIRFFALPGANGGIDVFPFALISAGFLVGPLATGAN